MCNHIVQMRRPYTRAYIIIRLFLLALKNRNFRRLELEVVRHFVADFAWLEVDFSTDES